MGSSVDLQVKGVKMQFSRRKKKFVREFLSAKSLNTMIRNELIRQRTLFMLSFLRFHNQKFVDYANLKPRCLRTLTVQIFLVP